MNQADFRKYGMNVPAPVINTKSLNAKVDVDGQDPHQVALDWMKERGFVK